MNKLAQVAMTNMSARGVFALVDGRKKTPVQVVQCQDHLGHKSIRAGCSNQMQVAQGQDLHGGGALVQAVFGCCTAPIDNLP